MIRKYLPGFENCQLVSIMPYTGCKGEQAIGREEPTLQDVLALNIPEDTVAIAGYNRDTHSPKDGQMHLLAVEHGRHSHGCLASRKAFSSRQGYLHRSGRVCHDSSDADLPCGGSGFGNGGSPGCSRKVHAIPIKCSELRQELVW